MKHLRFLQLGLLAAIFVVWYLLTTPGLLPNFMFENDRQAAFFFGEPLKIFGRIWDWFFVHADIYEHLWVTLVETVLAFFIGTVLGLGCGLWLALSPLAAAITDPYIKALNSMPRVILAPIFAVWFGLGIASKVALGVTLVFFIVFFNVYQGVKEVSPVVLANARMLGASQRQLLRHVYLPSATSWVFSSLHTSVGLAFVGAVVGEYLGSSRGVGYLILQAEGSFDIDTVMAGILVLTVFALALDAAVGRIENPGKHRRRAGLAVRAGDGEHVAAGEDVLGQPLRAARVGAAGIEHGLHQRVAARDRIADDEEIGRELELLGAVALDQLLDLRDGKRPWLALEAQAGDRRGRDRRCPRRAGDLLATAVEQLHHQLRAVGMQALAQPAVGGHDLRLKAADGVGRQQAAGVYRGRFQEDRPHPALRSGLVVGKQLVGGKVVVDEARLVRRGDDPVGQPERADIDGREQGHLGGRDRAWATPRATQRSSWRLVCSPSASTRSQPSITRPRISNGCAWGLARSFSVSARSTCNSSPPRPLALTAMWPPIRKAKPPNIVRSVTRSSSATSSRMRLARSSS